MKIIKQRTFLEKTEYSLTFLRLNAPKGCYYAFPCDKDGKPDPKYKQRCDEAFTHHTIDGQPVEYMGVKSYTTEYSEPAVGLCDCGRNVELDGFTCECDCGAFYNSSGQRLAHPSQWGEETGERLDDHGNYIGGGEEIDWD